MFDWFLDYMCTQGNIALIDLIKKIPYTIIDVEVVFIDSGVISNRYLEYLFQPDSYLGDEIIHLFDTRTHSCK